jgi:hypothetical protein
MALTGVVAANGKQILIALEQVGVGRSAFQHPGGNRE